MKNGTRLDLARFKNKKEGIVFMWVYVNTGAKYSPDKGKLYFMEDYNYNTMIAHFSYYDYNSRQLVVDPYPHVEFNNGFGYFGESYGYLIRLDRWNCYKYGWCYKNGSHYSLRESIQLYTYNGTYVTTLPSQYDIVFDGGYGYTKANNHYQIIGTGVGIRLSGFIRDDGTAFEYMKTSDPQYQYFASEAYTRNIGSYKINTI